MFNIFKRKQKEEHHNTYVGRFITDDEIAEMIKPTKESIIEKEMKDINMMLDEVKQKMGIDDGRE